MAAAAGGAATHRQLPLVARAATAVELSLAKLMLHFSAQQKVWLWAQAARAARQELPMTKTALVEPSAANQVLARLQQ